MDSFCSCICRNDGFDNADGDYICRVGDIVYSPEGIGYEIVDQLGRGTFGQVLKCSNQSDRSQSVAVKIVKNKPAYFQQGLVEVRILQLLNKSFDLRVVKMLDYFVFRKHLCIVFELLSVNLYDVIKHNNFRGLPFTMVKSIVDQLNRQLVCLKLSNIIHCDLKPENVLLATKKNTKIKLIDFGSAAFEGHQVYTYIQSRFYRSLDVIVGFLPFTPAIDMWSLGCIIAELFLGLPLFPGQSEYDQLSKIVELLGPIPSALLDRGRNTRKFFVRQQDAADQNYWRLRTREEYEEVSGKKEKVAKKVGITSNRGSSLREMIIPSLGSFSEEERLNREKLLSLISLCLEYDPQRRLTPAQAVSHPLFDESAGIEALRNWKPRPDEYCLRKLVEDPNSFVHHSSSSAGLDHSSGVDISGSIVGHTPVKPHVNNSKIPPLQPRNSQRPISSLSLPDDSMAVSYRPPLAKPPSSLEYTKRIQQSPSKNVLSVSSSSPITLQQSPTTVLRGGIPFSPGNQRLPAPTAYFFDSPQRRPRAHSNVEPEMVVRWPC